MTPEKNETIKNKLANINTWVNTIKTHVLLDSKHGVDMTPFNHIDKLTDEIEKILDDEIVE